MQNPINPNELYRLPTVVVDRNDDRCRCETKRSKSNRTSINNDIKKMKNKTKKNNNEENDNVSKALVSSTTSTSITDHYNDNDVLCGRGRISLAHEGNKRFCDAIEEHLDLYINAFNRNERSKIVQIIIDTITEYGGTFKKKSGYPPRYITLSYNQCREKVGHALRDTAKHIYKKRGLNLPSSFFNVDTQSDNNINSSSSINSSSNICDNSSSNLHDGLFSTDADTPPPTTTKKTMSETTKTLVNAVTSTPHVNSDNYYRNEYDQMNHTENISHTELPLESSEVDDSIAKLLGEEEEDIILLSEEQGNNLCLGMSSSTSSSDLIYIPQQCNIPINDESSIVMATAMLITTNPIQPTTQQQLTPAQEANVFDVQMDDEIDTFPYDHYRDDIFHHGNFINDKTNDDINNYNYHSNIQNNTGTIFSNNNNGNQYVPLYNGNMTQLPFIEQRYTSANNESHHYSDIIEPCFPPKCDVYAHSSLYEDYTNQDVYAHSLYEDYTNEDTKLDCTLEQHDEIAWDVKAIAEPIINNTNLGSNEALNASYFSFQMSFEDLDFHHDNDHNNNYNYNHNNDAMEIMNSSMMSLCLSHDSIEQQQKVLVVLCGDDETSVENYNNNNNNNNNNDYDDKKEEE